MACTNGSVFPHRVHGVSPVRKGRFMKTQVKTSRMDIGRLVAAPVFALLLFFSARGLLGGLSSLFPLDAAKALLLVHRLLIVAFYVLIVVLYFMRTAASSTTRSIPARSIAVGASFLPFAIPLAGGASDASPVVMLGANVIMASGMAFALAALFALGRSFSIIPQTRSLVMHGPYRLVRHPLYLGELVTVAGFVLAGVAPAKVLIFVLLAACQVYRALQEEKLLAAMFPEYEAYASRTPRLLPGVF